MERKPKKMSYNQNIKNLRNEQEPIDTSSASSAFMPADSFYTLYNAKLQNIFTDYQASKATIEKSEQQSLQDAYYIKEMSKKYLGEYASNLGLGDVSGNLMDIHSTYAEQRQGIERATTEAELQLDASYREGLSDLDDLRFQYEEGVKGEKAQKVASWLQMGEYGTREDGTRITDAKEFLDNELAAGNIDQAQYDDLLRVSAYLERQKELEEFQENLDIGYFGKKTDEEGNEIRQSRLEYITEAYEKGLLTQKEYDRLYGVYEWMEEIQSAQEFDIKDYTSPYLEDGSKNPNFISGLDPSYYSGSNLIDKNSLLLQIEGVDFISEKNAVDKNKNLDVTSDELTDHFEEAKPDSVLKYGELMYYRGEYYVYKQGTSGEKGEWYHMLPQARSGYKNFEEIINSETSGMKNWKAGSDNISAGWGPKQTFEGVTVKFRPLSALIEINGVVYQTEGKAIGGQEKATIEEEFRKVHGRLKNTIIFYNGKLYHKLNNGKIKEMAKVKKQEKKSDQVNK